MMVLYEPGSFKPDSRWTVLPMVLHKNNMPWVKLRASISGEQPQELDCYLDLPANDEVVFLVEYPLALCGSFDRKFLSLPSEVLVHSMKEHQRYCPLVDGKGALLPHFVCISNIAARDRNVVVKGNEKVLRARLSDAAFFFEDDLTIPLERVEQLKKVVFQAKLGTSYEKVMRFTSAIVFVAQQSG